MSLDVETEDDDMIVRTLRTFSINANKFLTISELVVFVKDKDTLDLYDDEDLGARINAHYLLNHTDPFYITITYIDTNYLTINLDDKESINIDCTNDNHVTALLDRFSSFDELHLKKVIDKLRDDDEAYAVNVADALREDLIGHTCEHVGKFLKDDNIIFDTIRHKIPVKSETLIS